MGLEEAEVVEIGIDEVGRKELKQRTKGGVEQS